MRWSMRSCFCRNLPIKMNRYYYLLSEQCRRGGSKYLGRQVVLKPQSRAEQSSKRQFHCSLFIFFCWNLLMSTALVIVIIIIITVKQKKKQIYHSPNPGHHIHPCFVISECSAASPSLYCDTTLSSSVSPKTSTSVEANLRAETRRSNKRSISAKVRPRGSGTRK